MEPHAALKNTSTMPGRILLYLPYLTIGIIVVCGFISAYGMELLGDDLNHKIRIAEKFPLWYQWPLSIPYQWLTGNGRFGDMIGNILLAQAPMWLLASLSAVMEGLFYLLATKMSFPKKQAALPRLLVIAVIMFSFPWWDSFFLFVCRINYIWTSALTLLTLWIVFFQHGKEPNRLVWWLMAPIALAAGWGHEACGMPIAAGLTMYFYIGRKFSSLPKTKRTVLMAFIIGGILSVTSPCSYSRLGMGSVPDASVPVLLLKSSFIALLLIATIGILCCFKSSRKELMSLCRTPWIVFTVGAMCSMIFVSVGGIVGRSGLFSQIFALIAFGILIRKLNGDRFLCKDNLSIRVAAVILFLIMGAHECGVCAYQVKGNRQLRECRLLYEASSDGTIFASPMQRNEFPWWTFCKNKACVDNDDIWLIEVYDHRLGHDRKHYRLLPEAFRNANLTELNFNDLNITGHIESIKPEGTTEDNRIEIDGAEYTVVEFNSCDGQQLYYVSPRIVDPGDK